MAKDIKDTEKKDMSEKDVKKLLEGTPTRLEVMNYMERYINEVVVPATTNYTDTVVGNLLCLVSTLQTIIISNKLATEDEIRQIYTRLLEDKKKKEIQDSKDSSSQKNTGNNLSVVK